MTITEEVSNARVTDDPQALFPEARRRRRRIRLIVGASLLIIGGVVVGLVDGIAGGGASPAAPSAAPASSAPSQIASRTILRDSLAVGSARESWRTVTSYPGCSPPVTGVGVVDLAHSSSAMTVSSPGCSGAGAHFMRGSYHVIQIGTSVYQTRQPQEAWNYGPHKSWLLTHQYTEGPLTAAGPLSVLKAVSGPFMRVGAYNIRGVATTEYVDSASLASIVAATGSVGSGPIGTPDPPLKQIPVQVDVWIDAQQRVRQISTWEPYYTQNYTSGASEGGAYILPDGSQTADAPPRQQGFVQTTLDLWQFGTPAHITPPPAASVATPR